MTRTLTAVGNRDSIRVAIVLDTTDGPVKAIVTTRRNCFGDPESIIAHVTRWPARWSLEAATAEVKRAVRDGRLKL